MSSAQYLSSLGWFLLVLALVPAALWLLKRSGLAERGLSSPNKKQMRLAESLSLSAGQRVVMLEVAATDTSNSACTLVLGVSPGNIQLLHLLQHTGSSPPSALPDNPATFDQHLQAHAK